MNWNRWVSIFCFWLRLINEWHKWNFDPECFYKRQSKRREQFWLSSGSYESVDCRVCQSDRVEIDIHYLYSFCPSTDRQNSELEKGRLIEHRGTFVITGVVFNFTLTFFTYCGLLYENPMKLIFRQSSIP